MDSSLAFVLDESELVDTAAHLCRLRKEHAALNALHRELQQRLADLESVQLDPAGPAFDQLSLSHAQVVEKMQCATDEVEFNAVCAGDRVDVVAERLRRLSLGWLEVRKGLDSRHLLRSERLEHPLQVREVQVEPARDGRVVLTVTGPLVRESGFAGQPSSGLAERIAIEA